MESKTATTSEIIKHSSDESHSSAVIRPQSSLSMSSEEQNELKERSKAAFYHAYDSYMNYAYPKVFISLLYLI